MKVTDIARVIAPKAKQEIIGIRPGEKIHEQMIGFEDAPFTYEYDDYFKILPAINEWGKSPERIKNGVKVSDNFTYSSDNNSQWMKDSDLKNWMESNKNKIGVL